MQDAQPSRPLSVAGPCLSAFQECQVVMMVGLPGESASSQHWTGDIMLEIKLEYYFVVRGGGAMSNHVMPR